MESGAQSVMLDLVPQMQLWLAISWDTGLHLAMVLVGHWGECLSVVTNRINNATESDMYKVFVV